MLKRILVVGGLLVLLAAPLLAGWRYGVIAGGLVALPALLLLVMLLALRRLGASPQSAGSPMSAPAEHGAPPTRVPDVPVPPAPAGGSGGGPQVAAPPPATAARETLHRKLARVRPPKPPPGPEQETAPAPPPFGVPPEVAGSPVPPSAGTPAPADAASPVSGPGDYTRMIYVPPAAAPAPEVASTAAPLRQATSPVAPMPVTDRVHFSVTAPPALVGGSVAELSIWAHLDGQRAEVLRRAAEQFAGGFRVETKGPLRVEQGTVLTVRLRVEGITVRPREDTIAWEGEIGRAAFLLDVPPDARPGAHSALATVHIGGVRVLRLDFTIAVAAAVAETGARPVDVRQSRVRRAFASYAHQDRDAVLARIQGIQKGAPDLDVFLDVLSLRSGDRWQERLRDEILRRDILYLFWSRAASSSTWVEWEWRCALRERGIYFIDPVPLAAPDQVPPPPELGGTLHFNDWVLAFMAGARADAPIATT